MKIKDYFISPSTYLSTEPSASKAAIISIISLAVAIIFHICPYLKAYTTIKFQFVYLSAMPIFLFWRKYKAVRWLMDLLLLPFHLIMICEIWLSASLSILMMLVINGMSSALIVYFLWPIKSNQLGDTYAQSALFLLIFAAVVTTLGKKQIVLHQKLSQKSRRELSQAIALKIANPKNFRLLIYLTWFVSLVSVDMKPAIGLNWFNTDGIGLLINKSLGAFAVLDMIVLYFLPMNANSKSIQ